MEGRQLFWWTSRRLKPKKVFQFEETKNICIDYLPKLFPYQYKKLSGMTGWESRRRNYVKFITFACSIPIYLVPVLTIRHSLPKLESQNLRLAGRRWPISSWKRAASPCKGTVPLKPPFSIVGSSRLSLTKFWCENHYKKRANRMNAGPTWCCYYRDMAGRGTDIKLSEECSRTQWDYVLSGQNVTKVIGSITSFVSVPGVKGIRWSLNSTWLLEWSMRVSVLNGSKAVLDRFKLEEEESVIRSNMRTSDRDFYKNKVWEKQLRYRKQSPSIRWRDGNNEIIYAERYDVTASNDWRAMEKYDASNGLLKGISHSSKERVEAILGCAEYNLVPENTISASDIEGKSTKLSVPMHVQKEIYASQVAKLRDEESIANSKSLDLCGVSGIYRLYLRINCEMQLDSVKLF